MTAAPAEPVEPPNITAGPVIISSPASGDTYGKDEAIVVAVTFSEAVTVNGQPRVVWPWASTTAGPGTPARTMRR